MPTNPTPLAALPAKWRASSDAIERVIKSAKEHGTDTGYCEYLKVEADTKLECAAELEAALPDLAALQQIAKEMRVWRGSVGGRSTEQIEDWVSRIEAWLKGKG